MSREPRSFEAGVVYHLISRMIERKFLIVTQQQRNTYLALHSKSLARSDWKLLGYATMSNHVHLAALAGKQPLGKWLRPVHSPFVELLNSDHDRIGPAFVRGPKAFAVPQERVGKLLAYIHNNPVRAGVCNSAIETSWTSHRAYVGRVETPPWLNVSLGLTLARIPRSEFDDWINSPDLRADRSFSEETHEREILLADAEVVADAESDEVAFALVRAIADAVGVPTNQLLGRSRGEREVIGRAAAAHCSNRLGLPAERIATALQLSRQRISVLRRTVANDETLEIASRVYERLRGNGNK